MHVHLCVALWLFSLHPSPSFTSFHRSPSGPSRCLPQSSTRGPGPTPCATSAWGPWPLLTTRHPSQFSFEPKWMVTKLSRKSLGAQKKSRGSSTVPVCASSVYKREDPQREREKRHEKTPTMRNKKSEHGNGRIKTSEILGGPAEVRTGAVGPINQCLCNAKMFFKVYFLL